MRAIYFLSEAIRTFEKEQPGIQVTPLFQYDNGVESFLKDKSDVLCTHKTDSRESLTVFIKTLQKLYKDAVAFPL